jgi:two-component sensor histidine kinase
MSDDRSKIVDLASVLQLRAASAIERADRSGAADAANHRIADHLSLIATVAGLHASDLDQQSADRTRGEVQLLLQGLRAQIEAAARLHRSLANAWPRCAIDLGNELHWVCHLLVSATGGRIALVEELAEGCMVQAEQLLPLTQIVSEVLTNAIKFGRRPDAGGTVVVRCRQEDGGAIVLQIEDDGAGLPEGFNPEFDGRLGLRIVQALSRQLGASVSFRSGWLGLHFELVLT